MKIELAGLAEKDERRAGLQEALNTLKGQDGDHHFFAADALTNVENGHHGEIVDAMDTVMGDGGWDYQTTADYEEAMEEKPGEYADYADYVDKITNANNQQILAAIEKTEAEIAALPPAEIYVVEFYRWEVSRRDNFGHLHDLNDDEHIRQQIREKTNQDADSTAAYTTEAEARAEFERLKSGLSRRIVGTSAGSVIEIEEVRLRHVPNRYDGELDGYEYGWEEDEMAAKVEEGAEA